DFATTTLEAILLLMGKAWGEWLVAIGLAALLIPELLSLEHSPSVTRFVVLLINAAVVAYLATRRLKAAREDRQRQSIDSKAEGRAQAGQTDRCPVMHCQLNCRHPLWADGVSKDLSRPATLPQQDVGDGSGNGQADDAIQPEEFTGRIQLEEDKL